jgi:hypothetical protein
VTVVALTRSKNRGSLSAAIPMVIWVPGASIRCNFACGSGTWFRKLTARQVGWFGPTFLNSAPISISRRMGIAPNIWG